MGERNIIRAFRETDREHFVRVFESTLVRLGGSITWNVRPERGYDPSNLYCAIGHRPTVQTVEVPYVSDALDTSLMIEIGSALDVPWMEIRIQEGSHWDYTLFRGRGVVDDFSTLPQYWDPDDEQLREMKNGHASVVAEVWGVPLSRIERYIVNWGYEEDEEEGSYRTLLVGKAYETDRHNYGDIWQMLDFINALGGCYPGTLADDPYYDGAVHTIAMPPKDRLRPKAKK